jgi:hypothetical protein
MRKILIVSQSHLCRNPRVLKEAIALSLSNFSVTILTSIYSEQLLQEDLDLLRNTGIQYLFYSDLRAGSIRSFQLRLIKKIYALINATWQIESRFSLGYGANRLLKMCLMHKPDLYIMHQELATVTGCRLLKKKRLVFFDIEDWYSEDLLPENRKARPVKLLKKSEKFALQQSNCCYTTSMAMAEGLANAYDLKKHPYVVYNSFNETSHVPDDKRSNMPIRLYWFSQTIGPGRGIEDFIDAMGKSIYNWDLTLRGNVSDVYKDRLMAGMNIKDSLSFLQMIRNEDLLADMQHYDIGLALEPNTPPNKNLTISNKFFHYLAAGLLVIASDTLGHLEIGAKHPEMIFIYQNNDIPGLTMLLNDIGQKHENSLLTPRADVISIFKNAYSWEIESQRLISLIKKKF